MLKDVYVFGFLTFKMNFYLDLYLPSLISYGITECLKMKHLNCQLLEATKITVYRSFNPFLPSGLVFESTAYLKFTNLQYVSSGFRCLVIAGSLMRLY